MSTQENNTQRPFAVFDIDGTVIRWQLFHAIVTELGRRELLPADAVESIKQARSKWKNRIHNEAFDAYQIVLVKALDNSIKTIQSNDFNAAVKTVFDEHKEQVYTYTRDLIEQLKKQNYLLFAISGSFQEVVDRFAQYYGFDDAIGSHYEQADGHFTGVSHINHSEHKQAALEALITKHATSRRGSIAVGDSEGDIAMLAMVEQPIAFNPSQKLFTEAKKQNWPIVVERKNVIYKLEPKNGSYVLV